MTGGAVFIGSWTVDLLLEKGYQVRILDDLQPRVRPRGKPDWVPQEAEFIQGDVANRAAQVRSIWKVLCALNLRKGCLFSKLLV